MSTKRLGYSILEKRKHLKFSNFSFYIVIQLLTSAESDFWLQNPDSICYIEAGDWTF